MTLYMVSDRRNTSTCLTDMKVAIQVVVGKNDAMYHYGPDRLAQSACQPSRSFRGTDWGMLIESDLVMPIRTVG